MLPKIVAAVVVNVIVKVARKLIWNQKGFVDFELISAHVEIVFF